ncbi:hypothetical protein FGO68_gene14216 [Halteria grandinella]|uniref:Uncharacterized protein n=1 Tax=Halteria grandinella TaxID=5974 RepID=A0A8J8NE82_HALGN|nr:hypothetical protein FGO68_gene14216 [Halteria grandinella]
MGKRRWFYTDKRLRRMRFTIHVAVCLVNIGIITQFIWCYIYFGENNPLNVAGVYYGAFVLVFVVHAMQLYHIHFTIKNPDFEKKKIIIVFAVLSVSYLARAILNTIQPQMLDLQAYNWPENYAWCAFVVCFYGIELFIPLQILFFYQFQSNKVCPMGKDLFNTITTVSNECDCPNDENSVKVSFLPNNNMPPGGAHTLTIQNHTMTKSPKHSPTCSPRRKLSAQKQFEFQQHSPHEIASDDHDDTMSFKEASPNVDSDNKRKNVFEESDNSEYDAMSSAIPLKQSEMFGGGLLMTNPNLGEGMEVGSMNVGDPYDLMHNGNVSNLSNRLFQKLRESHIQNIDRSSVVNQITMGLQQQHNERSEQSFRHLLPTVSSSTQQRPNHSQGGSSQQSNIIGGADDREGSLNHPSVTE